MQAKLRVPARCVRSVALGSAVVIDDVLVTFLDANHCPGSAMILFQHRSGESILHCGDMRYDARMQSFPSLAPPVQIDHLYLDTTYCDPKYRFPPQDVIIARVVDICRPYYASGDALLLIGTYSVGKERLLVRLAREFQCRVRVSSARFKDLMMSLPADDVNELFTTGASRVHVVPLDDLSWQNLPRARERLSRTASFTTMVAVRPTGWTHTAKRDVTVTQNDSVVIVNVGAV